MQYGKVSMTMKIINHLTKQDEAKHDKNPQELDEGQVDILPNWDMIHLGCYNSPPLQEDLVPRSRTERTPDIRNGGDPRAPRWLLGRNGVTTSLSGI